MVDVARRHVSRGASRTQEVTMAQIIAVASLGALLALAAALWKDVPSQIDVLAGANPVSLSINDIGLKANVKSLPEQRIEDRTLVFVGP
jgi:hypothetical protein